MDSGKKPGVRGWILTVFVAFSLVGGGASAEGRFRPETGGALDLPEAMQVAASRNLPLMVRELEREQSRAGASQARVAYRPSLRVSVARRSETRADETEVVSDAHRASLGWASPWGTSLQVSASGSRIDSGGNAGGSHGASVGVSASQPLLRGAWLDGAYSGVRIADIDVEIARARFVRQLNDFLIQAESAYWELAFAQADLTIKTRSRDRAQKQFEDTQENIRRGILAPAEVYIVEENLVFFEGQLVRARESLALAQNRLGRLLNLRPGVELVASGSLDGESSIPGLKESTQRAMETSPELHIQHLQVRRAGVQLAFDENQVLPAVDLEASMALLGNDEDAGGAWGQSFEGSRPDWRVGVQVEVPLGWDVLGARVERAEMGKRGRLLGLKEAEVQVKHRIYDLLVSLKAQVERLALVQRRVGLARKKLEAEKERYQNGISNLDAVSRFQRDLDNTLVSEQRARVEVRISRSRLLSAQGELHKIYGLEVE